MAWYSRAAVTDESTPPDRPQMTRASPTRRRIWLDRLLREIAQPPGAVAAADGHEEIAQQQAAQGRVRDLRVKLQAVHGQLAVLDGRDRARRGAGQRQNSSDTAVTWSPWLIHTSISSGSPSTESDFSRIRQRAGPYSRVASAVRHCPPKAWQASCMP